MSTALSKSLVFEDRYSFLSACWQHWPFYHLHLKKGKKSIQWKFTNTNKLTVTVQCLPFLFPIFKLGLQLWPKQIVQCWVTQQTISALWLWVVCLLNHLKSGRFSHQWQTIGKLRFVSSLQQPTALRVLISTFCCLAESLHVLVRRASYPQLNYTH